MTPVKYEVLALYYSSAEVVEVAVGDVVVGCRWRSVVERRMQAAIRCDRGMQVAIRRRFYRGGRRRGGRCRWSSMLSMVVEAAVDNLRRSVADSKC